LIILQKKIEKFDYKNCSKIKHEFFLIIKKTNAKNKNKNQKKDKKPHIQRRKKENNCRNQKKMYVSKMPNGSRPISLPSGVCTNLARIEGDERLLFSLKHPVTTRHL
jgi:hypothetical protein